ncbi:DUF3182 family protein [Croceibacterium sp. TMG7-5b_MA50]|uniref:DUF3182 family protein n=1 Tax=Croceibacterium sp. TMG7-5b_MA50 TaxID=3121290 RepID=UPI003221435F
MIPDAFHATGGVLQPRASIHPEGVVGLAMLPIASRSNPGTHEHDTLEVLSTRIASLLGVPFVGRHYPADGAAGALYLVPADTLEAEEGHALQLRDPKRFFGGVVPFPFAGTKAITHGLVSPAATRPTGWSDAMTLAIHEAVLCGFTVFDAADAAIAGERLLARGPVRVKPVRGKAGVGQVVVENAGDLAAVVAAHDPDELAEYGLCLEENLTDVVTYSVGVAIIGQHRISYWGTQSLTTNRHGEEVYGGSELHAVPGDLATLLDAAPDPLIRHVVAQAAQFDRVAQEVYPGLCLSRRNYDVIEGTDALGIRRVALLEQSWRAGGASGAELAAMEAFAADPTLTCVTTATVEVHGEAVIPDGATVYFNGIDPHVGRMAKWAQRIA